MTKLKKIAAVALIALTAASLAGCVSRETLEDTPNAVIRTSYNAWDGGGTFQYVDSDRQLKELPNCGRPSIFDKRYCETDDGSVRLEYTTRKGNIRNAVLTVNGTAHKLSCSYIEGTNLRGCLPKD